MRAHSMRSNQILHADETKFEEIFNRSARTQMLTRDLFAIADVLVNLDLVLGLDLLQRLGSAFLFSNCCCVTEFRLDFCWFLLLIVGDFCRVLLWQRPAITGFYPTKGPMSGGTLLTLYGTNLDAGRNVQVICCVNIHYRHVFSLRNVEFRRDEIILVKLKAKHDECRLSNFELNLWCEPHQSFCQTDRTGFWKTGK